MRDVALKLGMHYATVSRHLETGGKATGEINELYELQRVFESNID